MNTIVHLNHDNDKSPRVRIENLDNEGRDMRRVRFDEEIKEHQTEENESKSVYRFENQTEEQGSESEIEGEPEFKIFPIEYMGGEEIFTIEMKNSQITQTLHKVDKEIIKFTESNCDRETAKRVKMADYVIIQTINTNEKDKDDGEDKEEDLSKDNSGFKERRLQSRKSMKLIEPVRKMIVKARERGRTRKGTSG